MNRVRVAWAIASIALALSVVIVVTAILVSATKSTEIRDSQVTNTATLETTKQTLEVLLDCTDPKGECYQRGQESQKAAIDNITVIAAAAAACANQPGNATVRAVLDCTLRELEAATEGIQP